MKIEYIFIVFIIFAFIFVTYGLLLNDYQSNYPEIKGVDTSYSNKFNDITNVNNSISSIKIELNKIQESEGGWKIFESIVAISKILITTTIELLNIIPLIVSYTTQIGESFEINSVIIEIGIILLLVVIIISLVRWWRS